MAGKSDANEVICIHSATEQETVIVSRRSLWTIVAIMLVCVISGILVGSYLTMKIRNDTQIESTDAVSNDAISNTDPTVSGCPNEVKIVDRNDWFAKPSSTTLTPLNLPSKRVIIAHTASESCASELACANVVKQIQKFHIQSRGFSDIGYNFLIGGDGAVYIGRGWNDQGAHTRGYNSNSIGIALIGTFNSQSPTKLQLCALKKLIAVGVSERKLADDYELYGHRQLSKTESPGVIAYEIIKTWDHWIDKAENH